MKISILPGKVIIFLFIVFVVLFFAHLGAFFIRHGLGYPIALGLVPLFYFDAEGSLPTYFSGFCLGVCSVLLLIIGMASKRIGKPGIPWFFLACIFLFLSVDEVITIHEELIEPMRKQWAPTGIFYFAWLIPYGIGVLILAAVYLKFFLSLPRPIFYLFMLSAGLFLSGAVGMEMISGKHAEVFGVHTSTFGVMITIEESLEMIGTMVFIHALLRYLAMCVPEVSFVLASTKTKAEL